MLIKIIAIDIADTPKKSGKGTYKTMSVVFNNLTAGKTPDGKKLMDFAAPKPVWDVLAAAKKDEFYEIKTNKNDKGYIDWVEVAKSDAPAVQETAAPSQAQVRADKGTKVAGTWDVKNELDRQRFEFDKVKQTLIIRQSCLSTAATIYANQNPEPEQVIEMARKFEAYVNEQPGVASLADDFPE